MELRMCDKDRVSEICEIERSSFPDPLSYDALKKMAESGRAFIFAAEKGEIIGYVICEKVLDEGQITRVAVREKYRNKGFGKRILDFAVFEAKKNGMDFFTLEVRADNAAAIRLYEKCGFERVGLRRGYYDNPKCDALLMTLNSED